MNKTQTTKQETVPAILTAIPFPDEIQHLEDTEYIEAKRYMADYRGEIDPHEMFQNELALKQIDRTGVFAVGIWEKLAKLKASPYFARIDFHQQAGQVASIHYIGRSAFTYENELLIFDWRAPIASLFYNCEVGNVSFSTPRMKK